MVEENFIKKWELEWQHYKLQNESMDKRRTFFWLVQSAIFIGWFNIYYCTFLSILIKLSGIIISWCWFLVFLEIYRSIKLKIESLKNTEKSLHYFLNILSQERRVVKKTSLQNRWDILQPALFIIIWSILLLYRLLHPYLIIAILLIELLIMSLLFIYFSNFNSRNGED